MVAPTASFTGPSFYDEQLVPVQFGPFAEQLVARIPANVRGPVLEIACGTGALTRPLRERLDASVELVATDLARACSTTPRRARKAARASPGSARMRSNCLSHDGAFGAVACAFGFMFCPDRLAALREPGGCWHPAACSRSRCGTASRPTRTHWRTHRSSKRASLAMRR
jgi:hypothetical protein